MQSLRHLERRETLTSWPAEDIENGEAVGLLTNLHEEGVQIHSEHRFLKGETLTIRITVDAMLAGTPHISVVVENVWSSDRYVGGLHPAGFRIVDISDKARKSVRALIAAFSYTLASEEGRAESRQ
jgi:hypothetical protein